jgi:hypothetical protein
VSRAVPESDFADVSAQIHGMGVTRPSGGWADPKSVTDMPTLEELAIDASQRGVRKHCAVRADLFRLGTDRLRTGYSGFEHMGCLPGS